MSNEAREARNAYMREYRKKNKERLSAERKKYYQEHKEQFKQYAIKSWERKAKALDEK